MPRLTLPVSILLLLLFFVLLGQSYFEAKGRARRLDLLKDEVGTLGVRKAELEEELERRQSSIYVEEQAREQLGYVFPNEVIVVLPDWEKGEKGQGEVAAAVSSEKPFLMDKETPVWKRWGCLWFPGSWTCP